MSANQIVLFQSSDGAVSLPVQLASESVWLSQTQMARMFGKDRTVIGRHVSNAIREGEIDPKVVCAKFAHTTPHGAMAGREQVRKVVGYSLDVVISVCQRLFDCRRR